MMLGASPPGQILTIVSAKISSAALELPPTILKIVFFRFWSFYKLIFKANNIFVWTREQNIFDSLFDDQLKLINPRPNIVQGFGKILAFWLLHSKWIHTEIQQTFG